MRAPQSLLDPTNAVSIGDDQAVADAVDRILEKSFGAGSFDGELLHASFTLVGRLFAGEHPGYLPCDMPYHDLRHSLDTALVMARLIAGYQNEHGVSSDAFRPDYGLLGVLLGLLHDTGYIRNTSEVALCGPQLMAEHEARSVQFAGSYLRTTLLAHHAALAPLILVTQLGSDLKQLFTGYDRAAIILGQMLGSADLISQISDRWYPERCYYHLYPLSEAHLRSLLREWTTHYNHGRPHSKLGPGVPDPPHQYVKAPKSTSRHRLAAGALVLARSIMGGLHHEYSLALIPART